MHDFYGKLTLDEDASIVECAPEICRRLDPERVYHICSPYGGRDANDPEVGDTHGYTHLWFVPGRLYPNFLSENCRVSIPPLRTLHRMMTDEELLRWAKKVQDATIAQQQAAQQAAQQQQETAVVPTIINRIERMSGQEWTNIMLLIIIVLLVLILIFK